MYLLIIKHKIMKTRKLLFVALIALLTPMVASAQVNTDQLPKIDVNVSCDTLVTPDRFTLAITIIDNKGAGKAGIDNAEKKVLVPTLKAAGIDVKKDLVISNFYSTYDKKGNAVASKNYMLTVRSVAMLNDILAKLTNEDILVTVANTEVSNSESIINELKIKAIKAAKTNASQILEAVDCKIGRLLMVSTSIRTGYSDEAGARPMLMARKSSNSSDEGVDAYRKKSINTYLTVTYEIINK